MSTVPLYIGGTVKCIGRECAHFFVIAITVINMGGAPSTRLSAHALDMRAANARGLSRPAAFR